MAPSAINDAPLASERNSPKPAPAKLYTVKEPPFEGFRPIDTEGWARSNNETAIVIDNGICAYIHTHSHAFLT
jgi:actin-related protein 5